jgi:nitrite reductase/ring-hydroxylating ferredoxin subunit
VALRVRVCNLAEIADEALRGFQVTGVTWPVMVTRVAGELFAFPGVCPHDDVSLADYGVLDDDRHVRCRVHGYRFDLDSGRCEHAMLQLRRYRVTVIDDDVWVDLL